MPQKAPTRITGGFQPLWRRASRGRGVPVWHGIPCGLCGAEPVSGGWEINFVEMEPPTASLFNADGSTAKSLNRARAQIADRRTFIEKNRATVVRDLSRFAQQKDLVLGPRDREPTCHVGWPMHHPRSTLMFSYNIVIGLLPTAIQVFS
jgi:hypothetical protein